MHRFNIQYKVRFEKTTRFRDADQILVFVSPSWKYETNLEAVFCAFQQFSGSPRFRAYKNEHNLKIRALKVTKSEFLDGKYISFVSLCGAMGEDLVEILISHGF